MRFRAWLLGLPILLGLVVLAHAAETSDRFVVIGVDGRSTSYHRTDLLKETSTTADVVLSTSHGPLQGRFTGVLLWTLLERAGITRETATNELLRRTVEVTGADGYRIVLSVGELSPRFGAAAALVAYDQDGKPVSEDGGARLILPGDKAAGRSVADVVKIEVR